MKNGAAQERYESIVRRIESACSRADRSPIEVTLLGASKRQPIARLEGAYEAGLRDFAENRVQEAEDKKPRLPGDVRWHLIGPLQSNKARKAVELFDVFHAVDRLKIARHLDSEAGRSNRVLDCFLEVNLGEEESKHGFLPGQLNDVFEQVLALENLQILGLMAIPPLSETPAQARPWFVELRERAVELRKVDPEFEGLLSMGMSSDFEVAIEEGATHVRIGTLLFGEREHPNS